jgi:hypothetical protein
MKVSFNSIAGLAAICVLLLGLTAGINAHNKIYNTENDCSAKGALGVFCGLTCPDEFDCDCTVGMFSCTCNCIEIDIDTQPTNPTLYPGPEENWQKVSAVLSVETHSAAKEIGASMMQVYQLFATDKEKYLKGTEELEELYRSLPQATKDRVLNVLN